MIPAKIIEISDKVMVEYTNILKPDKSKCFSNAEYRRMVHHYESSKVIADVENILRWWDWTGIYILENDIWTPKGIELNQLCMIEPTTEGKCRIIKLN